MTDVRIKAVKNGYIITSSAVRGTYIATSIQHAIDQAKEILENVPIAEDEEKEDPLSYFDRLIRGS